MSIGYTSLQSRVTRNQSLFEWNPRGPENPEKNKKGTTIPCVGRRRRQSSPGSSPSFSFFSGGIGGCWQDTIRGTNTERQLLQQDKVDMLGAMTPFSRMVLSTLCGLVPFVHPFVWRCTEVAVIHYRKAYEPDSLPLQEFSVPFLFP
jgi:hypothetical protein